MATPKLEDTETDLTDNREPGAFQSRYPVSCWIQIGLELLYLLALGGICVFGLLVAANSRTESVSSYHIILLNFRVSEELGRWMALAVSGLIGGAVFGLKWLYHSVAYNIWNRDRVLWRLISPLNSGVVSLFVALLLTSGLVPFVVETPFGNMYSILGGGFFFGYFSDNLLASMHNLAKRIFGTLAS